MEKKQSAYTTLKMMDSVLVGIAFHSLQTSKDEIEQSRLNIIKNLANEAGASNSFYVEKESSGKPFLSSETNRIEISIAHTRQCEVVAWGGNTPVGVDIERSDRKVSARLARRISHPTQGEEVKDLILLSHWVIKEAALKLLGTGLRYPMNKLRIEAQSNQNFFIVESEDFPPICAQIKEWNSYLIGIAQFVESLDKGT